MEAESRTIHAFFFFQQFFFFSRAELKELLNRSEFLKFSNPSQYHKIQLVSEADVYKIIKNTKNLLIYKKRKEKNN